MNNNHLTLFDHGSDIVYDNLGTRRVFTMPFDTHDPVGSEERWKEVEDRLSDAYDALEAGTALRRPDVLDTLRDILAVHWARNPGMKQAHRRITDNVVASQTAAMAEHDDLMRIGFGQRTGLHATGSQALGWFATQTHRELAAQNQENWSSDRNQIHYQFACEQFSRHSVQIGYAEFSDSIIGDCPMVTLEPNYGGVGVHQGVALGDANLICMPISPTILIGIGPEPSEGTAPVGRVFEYSSYQLRGFVRWVAARPKGLSAQVFRQQTNVRTILKPRV